MKKIIVLVVSFICFKSVDAQVIKLIANPDTSAVGFDGENGVEWNGSLYTSYLNVRGKRQLAKHNGTTTTLINNPDTSGSIYQSSKFIVFKNTVYFMYEHTYNDYQLAKYDGTSVTIIPSPPNTFIDSYSNSFVIYNNELYIFYRDMINSFYTLLVKYDGSLLKTVFAPTSSGSIATSTIPFIYNNKLCFVFSDSLQQIKVANYNGATINFSSSVTSPYAGMYSQTEVVQLYNSNIYFVCGSYSGITNSNLFYLVKYNGSSLAIVNKDSSEVSSNSVLQVCNNKLYYTKAIATATASITNLIQYNGINNISLIANPDTGVGIDNYNSVLYNNKLFFRYENAFGKRQAGVFDGTSITLKPNKNTVDKGVTGFAVFSNKLYFGYINTGGALQIAKYTDTGSIYYKNPDTTGQFGGFSASYNNLLYIGYQNAKGKYQIAYLDTGANTINYAVTGKIMTPLNKGINNATISIKGTATNSNLSNVNGAYTTFLETGNYVLKPTKNNDVKKNNGVTAIDIILTQRHILNTTKLNSPYKIIAADVNNDKIVSNIDVILMKRLILGVDTTFKGNRLWAFVDSSYIFPDTTNPFPYKDSISFNNLTSNKTNQSFIGVKLGDVNYDWNPAVARGTATKSVELVYDVANLGGFKNLGGFFKVPITVKNFKDLTALQYTLHFNHDLYEFVAIRNHKLAIEYNASQANQTGNISFLWADAKGEEKSLEDGTEIFTLVLKSKWGMVNSEWEIRNIKLEITNNITEIEAWDKDNQQHNIILTQKLTNQPIDQSTNQQWFVSPNPNDGNIVISLTSNISKNIVFQLSNAVGKTLYTQSFEAIIGSNSFHLNLNRNAKLPSGVYFIKAIGMEGENVKKIVVSTK